MYIAFFTAYVNGLAFLLGLGNTPAYLWRSWEGFWHCIALHCVLVLLVLVVHPAGRVLALVLRALDLSACWHRYTIATIESKSINNNPDLSYTGVVWGETHMQSALYELSSAYLRQVRFDSTRTRYRCSPRSSQILKPVLGNLCHRLQPRQNMHPMHETPNLSSSQTFLNTLILVVYLRVHDVVKTFSLQPMILGDGGTQKRGKPRQP